AIVNSYAKTCPNFNKVEVLTWEVQCELQRFWNLFADFPNGNTKEGRLKQISAYFHYISKNKSLNGQDSRKMNGWQASFNWMIKEKSVAEVINHMKINKHST
ncbi:MAG: hypothetical protein LUC43_03545, partial [Burkholderiales bacterium]|nr:hypothetical protein [Burkholderiales bacterium]